MFGPGIWNDGAIFRDGLMTHLEPGEQDEMDRGYPDSAPMYVECPDGLLADPYPAVKLMAARVWSPQDTINERFMHWAILCTTYRHEFLEHQTVFSTIVMLTQVSLVVNPLLYLENNDNKFNFIVLLLFIFIFLPFQ